MKRTILLCKPGRIILYVLFLLYSISATAQQQVVWTGNDDTDWENPSNWSPALVPDNQSDVVIPGNAPRMPVIRSAGICHDITLQTGASLNVVMEGVIAVYNEINNNGNFIVDGVLSLQSAGVQDLPGGEYGSISVKAGGTVNLTGEVVVNDLLLLVNGKIQLNEHDIIIGAAGAVSGGNAASFLITNGKGSVKQLNLGRTGRSEQVFFPIGHNSSSYNPIWIQNHGTNDGFRVRVEEGIWTAYSGNNPAGSPITTHSVNRTWYINEDVPGGSEVDLVLQWLQQHENNLFSRNSSFVGHYHNGAWEDFAAASASGGNPYTQARTNITSFSPFGIFDQLQLLPVILTSFHAEVQGGDVMISWATGKEESLQSFEIESSADGRSFEKIGELMPRGEAAQYVFPDRNAFNRTGKPTNFYRLKCTDLGGKFIYSDILRVSVESGNKGLKILSNPFRNQLSIQFHAYGTTTARFILHDGMGNIVAETKREAGRGWNLVQFSGLDRLSSGSYTLTAYVGTERFSTMVYKQ